MTINLNFATGRKTVLTAIAAVLALGFAASDVAAQTLDAIRERGKIIVGIQGDNPPFGFLDTSGANDGYDADLARLFAESIGVDIEFTIVTNQNRIAALETGRVDALFATLGMSAERAKSLQYAQPYAEDTMPVIASIDSAIAGPEGLAGVSIGVPKGSSQETTVAASAPTANMLSFDDDSANIQALLSGQVDAIAANQFAIGRIEAQAPGVYEEKFILSKNYKGVGTRLGDVEINAAVNAFFEDVTASGKLDELYQKWFSLPLPAFPDSIDGVTFAVQ
jgi:polar amino acid transport system substrate-binding protein